MPSPSHWPKTDQKSLRAFYGSAGNEAEIVNLPVDGLRVKYEGKLVQTIRCHYKVAASLHRVLTKLAASPFAYVLGDYCGCFENRPIHGSTTPSLHARGAAIDFVSSSNGNYDHWPTQATMPLEVMEEFAREGWLPAGAFWLRDAMHFQVTQ